MEYGRLPSPFRESDSSYFERAERPHFQDNMVYVTERVGREGTASAIRFVKPEECALDPKKLHQEGVPYALCAEIGTNRGAMMHTRFIGLFHKTDEGLHFTGRFWVGSMLPWKWMRKRMPCTLRACLHRGQEPGRTPAFAL